MENMTKMCNQKIEMKLIEFEKACTISFSKRKLVYPKKQISLQLETEQMLVLHYFHQVKNHVLMIPQMIVNVIILMSNQITTSRLTHGGAEVDNEVSDGEA
ncbi:hypothetical protein H5410_030324 [Solanum commersonii]|uniref:Uncharacterized protein n=1 Tax=Solanum commersonii TaxID=4109 RepID=A0A9J5YFD5_SOLCO|nr:hypothetical protein H5410_030324 [Solanum commersonii]